MFSIVLLAHKKGQWYSNRGC